MPSLYKTHQLEAASSTFRSETFGGESYLVVSGVPVREQVLNGAFLPAAEIDHFIEAWNGVPVTIDHPSLEGASHGSANTPQPDVAIIGRFFNAEWDPIDRKMFGEYWISIPQASRYDEGRLILEAIRQNRVLEVSTGYFADQEDEKGVFADKPYDVIHRHLRPDHIAILLEKEGACSVHDGCGINRNAAGSCPQTCPYHMKEKKPMSKLTDALEKLGFKLKLNEENPEEPVEIVEVPAALQAGPEDDDDEAEEEPAAEGATQLPLTGLELQSLRDLAKAAPAITAMLQNAQSDEKTRRAQLNASIKAASGVYSDADLNALPLPFLEKLNGQLTTDFSGQGVGILQMADDDSDVLTVPAVLLAKPKQEKE